ncbi:MAG: hypothetical protein KAW93_07735, partial [Methanogenium sp.]|nr:hypothetical protein [Methanogenium sp.]
MTTHELKKWTSKIKEYKIRKNYSCASFRLPWNECLDVIGRDVVIQEVSGGYNIRFVDCNNMADMLQQQKTGESLPQKMDELKNKIDVLTKVIFENGAWVAHEGRNRVDRAGIEP